MEPLAELVALAKAGHFAGGNRPIIATSPNAANDSPTSPVAAPDGLPATQPLPPALERAVAACTVEEQALCSPAIVQALAAELPDCYPDFPPEAARRWVAERLGLSVRFWNVTRNGRRWRVEFTEPQTRAGLLEQAARNQPGESLELEPALRLLALRDNATIAVSDNDKPPTEPLPDNAMQQALLLPDNAPIAVSDTAPAPAGRWLEQAGVSVRYVATSGDLERALSELAALPEHGGPWGLDIETMPLPAFTRDSKAGLDPWRSVIRLAQVYPGGDACYVFDVAALGLSPLAELLNGRALVAHNAVFEWKFLLHAGAAPARLGCSLLMANALRGDRPALATLAADTLGWRLDKTLQVSDWGGALSGAQLDYAALDAVAAGRLARELSGRLKDTGRGRCYGLMRDAQRAIAALERAGCPFDTAAHAALLATWQGQAEAARGELDSLLNGANPDSPLQLSRWLAANLPPDTVANWPKTAGGQLQTDADAMAGLSLPALEPLRRYKAAMKLLGTYGEGYAAHISPVTGRIHASFALGGTATGRLACRSPNIQNPPRGAEFRALFAPKAGRVFVVADYSQIELRVAALVSGDSAMLAAYEAGEDLHRKTAAAVLGIEPGAVTKGQRQMAKAVNFGLLFGQGAAGLQRYAKSSYGVDLTATEADKARTAFFKAYPGLSHWQAETRRNAERAGQVRTPGGRVRPLEGQRALATESLNSPIQGGAAECLLAALAALELDSLGAQLVNVVHDELIVECDPEQAGAVAAEVERAMVAGFLAIFPDGCTRDLVEAHSGPNWAAAKG